MVSEKLLHILQSFDTDLSESDMNVEVWLVPGPIPGESVQLKDGCSQVCHV